MDVDDPDTDRFPGFLSVPYMEVVLAPGEALFMPSRWWHYVRAESMSFSVSYWWT